MKRLLISFVLLISISPLWSQQRKIGVNLADMSNFSSQIVFVDVMRQSSEWSVQSIDESEIFIEGATVPPGPNGYPGFAPFQHDGEMVQPHVSVLNSQPQDFLHPSGAYTLMFEGEGEVRVRWDVDGGSFTTTEANVAHTINVNATTLGLNVLILTSDASDPVRNIRLVLPGFADVYETEPYHPTFLSLLEPFEALRFMKPLAIEENTISEWTERTEVEHYTYVTDETERTRFHLPYEHVIGIANLLNKDIWVNVPPFANTGYVEEMAALFASQLNEGINLYIEYSNESWNTLYPVTREFMIARGKAMGFGEDDTEANVRYHAFRSFQIWDEFKTAFSTRSGQIREVLGSQSFIGVGRISIDAIKDPLINPKGTIPHSIAIASYMGIELVDELVTQHGECGFDADDIMDRLEEIAADEIAEYMPQFKFWSDSTGIEVVAYEGGQHLSIGSFGINPQCIADAVAEANRSERMNALFCRYFDLWFDEYNGGLFMSFLLAESYGLGGSFGILESTFQDPATSQKWQAHAECAFPADPPMLEVTGSLSFENTNVGESSMNSFEIRNTGESDLIIDEISFPEAFSAEWTQGTITAGNSQAVMVSFSPVNQQTYNGDIIIRSNAGNENIAVSGEGVFVTGIDLSGIGKTINLYPNPSKGLLTIDLQGVAGAVAVQISDSQGISVVSGDFHGGKRIRMDLSKIPAGLYMVRIAGVTFDVQSKILIER